MFNHLKQTIIFNSSAFGHNCLFSIFKAFVLLVQEQCQLFKAFCFSIFTVVNFTISSFALAL
ncbi:hypothetical protein [Streptococcus sp. CSL10205-OR2]|uniref:hypothetical protein n=1 Tax=Streptococcus sp. CSL10205-OR2 TaxID=2980558 RepID=UPI0021D80913|nr:hypothetical protein [Streptococcus sp. CSL10205-OR2]MCU9533369.1 hypothetical protein [Streptococcus sp. CSL10205-OR2]